jgi:predicted nucleotidyltransferase
MLQMLDREASTLDDIQPILDEVVARLRERFGEDLVSVVLYGSYARGNAGAFSDIDLVVVLTEVPREWDALFALEHEVGSVGRGLGKKVQGQVLSREDVRCSVDWPVPMVLEVLDAHRVLKDRDDFLRRQMERLRERAREHGIRRLPQGGWEIPAHAT